MEENIIYQGWVEHPEGRYRRLCQSMAKSLRVKYGKEKAYKIVSTCVGDDWESTYRNMVQKYKNPPGGE